MLVYGNLERAALDLLGSDPSTAGDKFVARVWYNTATNLAKYWDGTEIRTLVNTDLAQTLTNKILSGNAAATLISASGSGTLVLNTSGTITLPGATDTLVGRGTIDTFTFKTIDADGAGNVISNIANTNIKAAAAIAVDKLAALTASRAVVSDGSGFISPATTTATEVGYLNGVTSAIQTQINTKQTRSTLTTKGDLYVATGSDTVARQGVGIDGQVLVSDSGQTNGIAWQTPTTSPDQSYEISNLGIAASVGSSALTIALKDKSGSDASGSSVVKIGMRSSTLTTGTYSQRTVSGSLSLVISSGTPLGFIAATAKELFIYAMDSDGSGAIKLCASTIPWGEGKLHSTVKESETITCTSATPAVVTETGHNRKNGDVIQFSNTGGALPTGISASTKYYVKSVSGSTYQIAATQAGASINTSDTGTGTHTAHTDSHKLVSDAVYTDKPIRLIGRITLTQATPGTWATAPSEIALTPLNPFACISSVATQKTPSATSTYQAYAGNTNSLVLEKGKWRIKGEAEFSSSGTANYGICLTAWGAANGADSGTPPAALSTVVTFLTLNVKDQHYLHGPNSDNQHFAAPTLLVEVTGTTIIYLNTWASIGTAANARTKVWIEAERIT